METVSSVPGNHKRQTKEILRFMIDRQKKRRFAGADQFFRSGDRFRFAAFNVKFNEICIGTLWGGIN